MSIWLPFKKTKQKESSNEIIENIPSHIAIIMDGNGRWAGKKGLPRIAGHKEGMSVVRNTVRMAVKYSVDVLTLYAFSTENWKRPKPEVDFIMKLPKEFSHVYLPEMKRNNVQIDTIGDFDSLPTHTKKAIQHAKDETKHNDGLKLNFALNYGGRYEIIRAIKQIATACEAKEMDIEEITESSLEQYLYTNHLRDPDLLIRTSGEKRLSNFLLWQSAYTEFWFTEALWPDFNETLFEEALKEYEKRKRRYGGV
ncbi:MAG TPA: isoprenyl transferase [Pseudogracilibacillus sp.]|nr:isoprenyl transferase [Pseudogracilibacillus sp.]